jgi:hypothetical protein
MAPPASLSGLVSGSRRSCEGVTISSARQGPPRVAAGVRVGLVLYDEECGPDLEAPDPDAGSSAFRALT